MAESATILVARELPRRERRKLEIHNRILEAAAALFEERNQWIRSIAKPIQHNNHGEGQDRIAELVRAEIDDTVYDEEFPGKDRLNDPKKILDLCYPNGRELDERGEYPGPLSVKTLKTIIFKK